MLRKLMRQKSIMFHFSKIRKEKDTFGYIDVPAEKYWGAQT